VAQALVPTLPLVEVRTGTMSVAEASTPQGIAPAWGADPRRNGSLSLGPRSPRNNVRGPRSRRRAPRQRAETWRICFVNSASKSATFNHIRKDRSWLLRLWLWRFFGAAVHHKLGSISCSDHEAPFVVDPRSDPDVRDALFPRTRRPGRPHPTTRRHWHSGTYGSRSFDENRLSSSSRSSVYMSSCSVYMSSSSMYVSRSTCNSSIWKNIRTASSTRSSAFTSSTSLGRTSACTTTSKSHVQKQAKKDVPHQVQQQRRAGRSHGR
jgi:hypothetical protein